LNQALEFIGTMLLVLHYLFSPLNHYRNINLEKMGVYQDNFEPSPGIYWHNTPCSALAVSPLNHYWNINPEKMGIYQDTIQPMFGWLLFSVIKVRQTYQNAICPLS
jgi:hypothetical protein